MNVTKTSSSLTSLIKTMPMDEEHVLAFRGRAMQALDLAVDVFFKPEREVAEGKKAYDQLTDVESALRAYQGRLRRDVGATADRLKEEGPDWKAPEARTELVDNQPSVLPDGKPIGRGQRNYFAGQVLRPELTDVAYEQKEKLANALVKMGEVLPLYASVAMVPGPLSVSLKDHLHQSRQWNSQSQASSHRDFQEESVRLLTLSAGRKTVRESSASSSEGAGQSESVTVDERVMSGLQAIRGTLDGIGFVPAESGLLKWSQGVEETELVSYTTGWIFKETHEKKLRLNSGYLNSGSKEVETAPAYLAMGLMPSNEGLKASAGSDLIDLVDSAAEPTPELLAKFQERGRQLLDQAVSTLFQTDREVADGRKAFDGLTNLARGLRLADQTWAPEHSARYWQADDKELYATNLGRELHDFEKAIALYACVAMVPGEMSSSVRNYAKELATFQIFGSSQSSNDSREVSGSLLTGGLSVGEGQGEARSSFSKQSRFETSTSDERIMPALHRLGGLLEELEIVGGDSPRLRLPRQGA